MSTLQEVIAGLTIGKAYKRQLDNDPGYMCLKPILPHTTAASHTHFTHIVIGINNGGWGGVADLPISILYSGKWPDDGYITISDA